MRTVVSVVERVVETPSTVTLRFDDPRPARPGQFVMLWVPGDDELPMSLAYVGARKGVTVKAMGGTSRRILDLPVGTRLGVRGPYGTSFDLSPRRILLVGGGSGTAVLAPAAEAALANGSTLTAALGATTKKELLFEERLRSAGATVVVATDDGTAGERGYVTGLVERLLADSPFDVVWTCGPEVMMQKVVAAAGPRSVPVVCSVERHMKCAVGMCDACALGPYHVCVDGPVFPAERIASLPEFGRTKRAPSGRSVPA
ncbi:MAG: dihydroorotate dehydrogenase electron transfer subunit [Thermoplasmata archaeon]|nr:dihydroorotate dehydrogenase electron transfer subunit [Thermoplasmata archaeon]